MTKQERQLKIKELISGQTVSSQYELLSELKSVGIEITQATLSRDCAELGIVRMYSGDSYKLSIPASGEKNVIKNLIGVEILSIQANEIFVIIKTLPGRASGVASFIDSFENPMIIGTLAGDDTVMVIPKTIKETKKVHQFIRNSISDN
ncbi:arginine repressor, ArgR [Chloroherpeton thalassium ATCC 35110]|uniref:Arginine repressor n=1 Tax=Chloroherpeton thalassium (strain ATCC 35110 / GB-78) TaxID=517418 RepID=ARGR_CHLT3|nr:arginine repressor [Chloroherpeton thalassium]B3QWH2.1 RecName: Full=Arginine repressor [Chloroherpeton thalassium ATCC 35110]ACF14732.1 arginine repressor, ArgR [Chloroherpeton thalassium ATCC 35110]